MNKKEMRIIAKDFIENNIQFEQGQDICLVVTPENAKFGKILKSELKKLGAGGVTLELVKTVPLIIEVAPKTEEGAIFEIQAMNKKEMRSIVKDFIKDNVQFEQGQDICLVVTPENAKFGKILKSELKKLGAGGVTIKLASDEADEETVAEENLAVEAEPAQGAVSEEGVEVEKEPLRIVLAPETEEGTILEVRNLKKYFVLKKTLMGKPISTLKAVDGISFTIKEGETLGIVGESGCGKTTMGRTVLKLHQPTGGQIIFEGKDITCYMSKQMRALRTKMQIVFQDPYSSLPPRSTVGDILSEPVRVHNIVPPEKVKEYVLEIMEQCGLRDYYYERYPHEFSGGQRQRICIARALAVAPKLVVCDEPVSALDVSIQAQIINLLKKIQEERKLTYLFISHDLSVVKYISDKIGVMYLGSMVEFGDKDKIFDNPLHPYTNALFSAVPNPNPDEKSNRILLKGDIPSPANPPKGCKFHTRCPKAMEICSTVTPEYREYEEGHFVACHCCKQES